MKKETQGSGKEFPVMTLLAVGYDRLKTVLYGMSSRYTVECSHDPQAPHTQTLRPGWEKMADARASEDRTCIFVIVLIPSPIFFLILKFQGGKRSSGPRGSLGGRLWR